MGRTEAGTTFTFEADEEPVGVLSGTIRYADPFWGFESQSAGFGVEGHLLPTDPCCDGFTYDFASAVQDR